MTQPNKRPLFRETAMQHYLQKREKDTLPRLASPPAFLCFWILTGLVAFCAFVAWNAQVPIFINGNGVVLADQQVAQPGTDATATGTGEEGAPITLFIPIENAYKLQIGQIAQFQVGPSTPQLPGRIVGIEKMPVSPVDLRKRYNLPTNQPITGPVLIAELKPLVPFSPQIYAGSQIQARVQIGTQRILALVPGLTSVLGEQS